MIPFWLNTFLSCYGIYYFNSSTFCNRKGAGTTLTNSATNSLLTNRFSILYMVAVWIERRKITLSAVLLVPVHSDTEYNTSNFFLEFTVINSKLRHRKCLPLANSLWISATCCVLAATLFSATSVYVRKLSRFVCFRNSWVSSAPSLRSCRRQSDVVGSRAVPFCDISGTPWTTFMVHGHNDMAT